MAGEDLGWRAIGGWEMLISIIETLILIGVPGFFLSLALFPKRDAMALSERIALSFGLGLLVPFALMLLNIGGVPVNALSSWGTFIGVIIIGAIIFIVRGGDLNLLKWYNSKA